MICRGLRALPEDVLLAILGHLSLPSLLAVRLVCRLLYKLSVSVITSWTIDANRLTVKGSSQIQYRVIEQLCDPLRCVTNLGIRGGPPEVAAILQLSKCASMLRQLTISNPKRYNSYEPWIRENICSYADKATGLTFIRWETGVKGPWLVPLLTSCPQLAFLEVGRQAFGCSEAPAAVQDAVLQRTRLRMLRVSSDRLDDVWVSRAKAPQILPRLTTLPLLADLASMPLRSSSPPVPALTSLTRLQVLM